MLNENVLYMHKTQVTRKKVGVKMIKHRFAS